MTVKIGLRLSGLDLRDIEAFTRIPEELTTLSFQTRGPLSLAFLYSDAVSPAADAVDWAGRIRDLIPGVTVERSYDELVGVSDIALRCAVAPEAARLWAAGKRRASVPFPAPREVVGPGLSGRTMNLYAWSEVVGWVRQVVGIDPDEGIDYLDERQHVLLDARLAGIADGGGWRRLPVSGSVTTKLAPVLLAASPADSLLGRMDELLSHPTAGVDLRAVRCR